MSLENQDVFVKSNWKGKNMLGRMLMELRETL